MRTEKDTPIDDQVASSADKTKKDAEDSALSDAEKTEQEFDRNRQKADQELANKVKEHPTYKRVAAEKVQLSATLDDMRAKQEQLRQEIQQLKASKDAEKEASDNLPDIDLANATVEDYGKAIQKMATVIKGLNKELAVVKTKTHQSEAERQQEKQAAKEQKDRDDTLSTVCTILEKKHGAGLRNRAIQLMDERIKSEGGPATTPEATLMLEECFESAKTERKESEKKDGSRKKTLVTDTGGGGRSRFGTVQIKTGSLDDVAAQFSKLAADTG
jgi:hypothetical protein